MQQKYIHNSHVAGITPETIQLRILSMNTKFIITIVLLFTLTNIFSHQEDSKEVLNKGLTIQLSSETDTCYYSEDEIVIYIEFKNEKFRPLIINRNMIVSTKDLLSTDVIKLKISR